MTALWAVETVGSIHHLHDNLAPGFIAVKESLRPNSSKYARVCDKADVSMIIQFILASWGKAPSLSGIPAGSWPKSPSEEEQYFQGRTNQLSSRVRKQRPWGGGRTQVKWASGGPVRPQRLRARFVDSHTCVGRAAGPGRSV